MGYVDKVAKTFCYIKYNFFFAKKEDNALNSKLKVACDVTREDNGEEWQQQGHKLIHTLYSLISV